MDFLKKKQNSDNNTFENFPAIGGLMVSKTVVNENIKPRFVYREKRSRPQDSGWRIFTGFETEYYLNDPENVGIYSPSTILNIDSSLHNILLKGIGSVYEKSEDGSEWYKVTDFELEDDYMVTHKLTRNWTIDINNLFERKIEESGDLFYTTGDKSVRIAIWNEDNRNKLDIYSEYKKVVKNRDQTHAKTLQTFDFSDEDVFRVGYLIEENDGRKKYGVVYAFSIIDNQRVLTALYFDEVEDLDWALETWKSIKLHK